jgi:DNA-directed RNA polymerase subunit RPC12/RpoP
MPGPRADFECRTCGQRQGVEVVVWEDLPADAKRCPYCGHARGFKRLYNTVQISTRGHRAARFIDRQMDPAWHQWSAQRQAARAFERQATEAIERAWEQAPPEARQQAVAAGVVDSTGRAAPPAQIKPAAVAMGLLDQGARAAARTNVPLLRRTVVPRWQG